MYYVYLLRDGGVPFYVGKGTKDRMYHHAWQARKKARNLPVHNKIRKMWREGRDIEYEIVSRTEDDSEAFAIERRLIAEIGRRDRGVGSLMNLTDGGEGVSGYEWTSEHRANLSKAIRKAIAEGRFTPGGEGFTRDAAYKKKMSLALRRHHREHPWSDDERREWSVQMRKRLVGGKRVLSDDARRRMSEAAQRGNANRKPSTYRKISQGVRESWQRRHNAS
jgi:hypothetical protein